MLLVPPWVASGSPISATVTHPYLTVTANGLDFSVYYALLAVLLYLAVYFLLGRKLLKATLFTVVAAGLIFVGAMKGSNEVHFEPRLVVNPLATDVMAEIAGCKPGWVPEREIPNGCGNEAFQFSKGTWEAWYDKAERIAAITQEKGCVFLTGSIHNVVACSADIPPTTLRHLVGFQNLSAPSRRCQAAHVLQGLSNDRTSYSLPNGNYAVGYQERTVSCMNLKEGTMQKVQSNDLWLEDLKDFEAKYKPTDKN